MSQGKRAGRRGGGRLELLQTSGAAGQEQMIVSLGRNPVTSLCRCVPLPWLRGLSAVVG